MNKKRERVYISGPITGLPREVYLQNFAKAEQQAKERGYDVCNPTRTWVCRWPWLYRLVGYRLTLIYDLYLLSHCQYFYMLPGWEHSKGASEEYDFARTIGKKEIKFY